MEVAASSVLLLPYTASSVGVARRRLIGDLTDAGVFEATACDAGLVLSELISNALRHATPLPGDQVKVAWRLHRDIVEISVSDGGGPTQPAVGQPTNSAVGGRGLGIVDRLSLRWGVNAGAAADGADDDEEPEADETTVWAELPLHVESAAENSAESEGVNVRGAKHTTRSSSHLVIASSRDA